MEAVLRAGRLESQAMWEIVLRRAPTDRVPAMASLTMRYMDAINVASKRGYAPREDLGRSLDKATRLFLSRLMRGDFADEAEAAGEARLLGFDLARFRVGIVVEPDRVPSVGRSAIDMQLVEAAAELRAVCPGSPSGLVESGLVLAVPATSPDGVAEMVAGALARPRMPVPRLIAGVGSPRAGAAASRRVSHRHGAPSRWAPS